MSAGGRVLVAMAVAGLTMALAGQGAALSGLGRLLTLRPAGATRAVPGGPANKLPNVGRAT